MSYRLEAGERVEDAVRRIATEQIEKSIDEVEDSDLGAEETVHQARKRCKKVRGLLRLTRPAFVETYRKENAFFRDQARELAALRDATSRLECLDGLRELADSEGDGLRRARDVLVAHRDELYGDEEDVENRLSRFRAAMRVALRRLDGWELEATGFEALGPGAKKTYKRGRKAMDAAYDEATVEAFHEWRKRAKYQRYHVRLLRDLWEPVFEARREELHELTDLLGDAHDLAVLREWLVEERDRFDAVEGRERVLVLADTRRKELDALALPLGRRLFADKPKHFTRRVEACWDAFRLEREIAPAVSELH